ncbi:Uncharacterized protein RDABS01_004846 [Bienertia sinuspersici]
MERSCSHWLSEKSMYLGVDLHSKNRFWRKIKWKFRGSERIEVDGYPIQLSCDVYNWLFEQDCGTHDDYALFTFRFEK